MEFELVIPTKIVFGPDCLDRVGSEARAYGRQAIIVSGSSARTLGSLSRIIDRLQENDVKVVGCKEVSANPKSTEVDLIINLIRETGADLVVGLGGGSALDAAKAAAVGVQADSVSELVGHTLKSNPLSLPIIAIPTTAGTGSEVTRGSIITDVVRNFKSGIRGDDVFPKVALIDTNLIESMPNKVMCETVFDSFTHGFETYLARKSHPISEILSLKALSLLAEVLSSSSPQIEDYETRSKLAMASLLGGINIGNVSSCLPHRLQQAMGGVGQVDCSHGRGLSSVYQAWIAHAFQYSRDKCDRVATIFGHKNIVDAITHIQEQLEMPRTITDIGYNHSDIPFFIKNISGNIENDPIPNIDSEKIRSVYEMAL